MSFESARLFPRGPAADPERIRSHLSSLPWAFRDPVEGEAWHLSATERMALFRRAKRLAIRDRFPAGVIVHVHDDEVGIGQRATADEQSRACDFVTWLLTLGEWDAQIDWGPRKRLVGIGSLYPRPLSPVRCDSPCLGVLQDGTRTTWTTDACTLIVHSSGAVRFESGESRYRAHVEPDALTRFNAHLGALEPLDANDSLPSSEVRLRVEEDGFEEETTHFGQDAVPAELAELWAFVQVWMASFHAGARPAGLAQVHLEQA